MRNGDLSVYKQILVKNDIFARICFFFTTFYDILHSVRKKGDTTMPIFRKLCFFFELI